MARLAGAPQDKLTQITRQLKATRGRLVEKQAKPQLQSPVDAGLVAELHLLEAKLEVRDGVLADVRALLSASGAERCAAALAPPAPGEACVCGAVRENSPCDRCEEPPAGSGEEPLPRAGATAAGVELRERARRFAENAEVLRRACLPSAAEAAEDPHSVCRCCSTHFKPDAFFCQKCGAKRPDKEEEEECLHLALRQHGELLAGMQEAAEAVQLEAARLLAELERVRQAQRTLQAQTRAIVGVLELDREEASAALGRARAEVCGERPRHAAAGSTPPPAAAATAATAGGGNGDAEASSSSAAGDPSAAASAAAAAAPAAAAAGEESLSKEQQRPPAVGAGKAGAAATAEAAVVPCVLIKAELELGTCTASISIAPWQSKADVGAAVDSFLTEHRIRPVFADALVRYLEEVEVMAEAFPATVKADLADIYSRFG